MYSYIEFESSIHKLPKEIVFWAFSCINLGLLRYLFIYYCTVGNNLFLLAKQLVAISETNSFQHRNYYRTI